MRIDTLKLIAFGPFTDTDLDLRGGEEGLHLVYGPNEAGKSSALRAIRNLLYGIPERSDDNFIHSYQNMRIGASIQSEDGKKLNFIRRKGRGNTLRSEDDEQLIEDEKLSVFLKNVDASLFETMFGIGHDDLIRGGRDIVKGGGDIGRLIFSAGSGILNLKEIQNELQNEIDQYFKPTGHKPIINETIGEINRLKKEMRETQLPFKEWEAHDSFLRHALMEKRKLDSEIQNRQVALNRLQRIHKALPVIVKRKDILELMDGHASAVLLPDDFSEKRRTHLSRLDIAVQDKVQAEKNILFFEDSIKMLNVSDHFIKHSEMIEKFFRELGSQGKASKDRSLLSTRRSSLLGEAKEILMSLKKDMKLEDAEELRIEKTQIVKIHSLSSGYERIRTRIEDSNEKLAVLDQELKKNENSLRSSQEPIDIEDLKLAVSSSEDFRLLQQHVIEENIEISLMLKTVQNEIKRLGLESKSFDQIVELTVPGVETLRIFENKFSEIDKKTSETENEVNECGSKLMEIDHRIGILRLEQDVPSEQELIQIRRLRDNGWKIIRKELNREFVTIVEKQDYLMNDGTYHNVEDFYDSLVKKSDEISDRLRREADRVAQHARLIADKTHLESKLKNLNCDLKKKYEERTILNEKWTSLWDGIGVHCHTPREMVQWTQDCKLISERIANIEGRKVKVSAASSQIEAVKSKILNLIEKMKISISNNGLLSFGDLLKIAKSIISREEEKEKYRRQINRDKEIFEREYLATKIKLSRYEEEFEIWKKNWEEAVKIIGLDKDSHPIQANTVMETLKSLFDKLKEAKILEKRISGIDRDSIEFESKVKSLSGMIAQDLSDKPIEVIVMELNHRLKAKRDALAKKETLDLQLVQEKKRLERSLFNIIQIETELQNMCKEANSDHIDGLIEKERLSEQKRSLQKDLSFTEDSLRQLSGGIPLNDFVSEADKMDSDQISFEIETMESHLLELAKKKSELDQTIGSENALLLKMDGGTKAAELAEKIQTLFGRLEADVLHYAQLKTASIILKRVIDRYRDKNQGSILRKASFYFQGITEPAFEGVRAEYNEKGDPMLTGIRKSPKEIVSVNQMSEGTADQLYLSLRLAGLSDYLEKNEPIPFVVDDILLKFDDKRAVATLKMLYNLSKKTQIILFTHHDHIVKLAKMNLPEQGTYYHILSDN